MAGIEKFSNLVIPDGRVPIAAYQAIYHRITQNTEHLASEKHGAYKIGHDEIQNLHRQIEQTIQQYKVEAKSESISFVFSDGEFESYSSFDRYSIVNLGIRSGKTTSFSYSFDFLVILPVEIEDIPEIAQRYRISISISVPDSEDDAPYIYHPNVGYLSGQFHSNIEYADRAVANNIQNVVNNWLENIEITKKSGLDWIFDTISWVTKHAVVILILSCLAGAIWFEPEKYSNAFTPIRFLISVIFVCFIFGSIGDVIHEYAKKNLRTISTKTFFDFTSGDKKDAAHNRKKRIKARSALIFCLTGIVVSSLVGVFVNAISEIIMK